MTFFKPFYYSFIAIGSAVILNGCATINPELISDSPKLTQGVGTPVFASMETAAVGSVALDSADDPEIWVDSLNPDRALIYGTDKKAGLYVYDLKGKVVQFLNVGPMNNVDLRQGLKSDGLPDTVIGASDRAKGGVSLFTLDPLSLKTSLWGFVPLKTSEAYGFCMGLSKDGRLSLILVGKDGDVVQAILTTKDNKPVASEVRRFSVGSQSEGCVIDDANGTLYLAEEMKGIWAYGLDPMTGSNRAPFQSAPSDKLKTDVEGLTILRDGPKTYLIASSQGDSSFAIWRIDDEPTYQGRFSVMAANGIDAVTGTDGVAAIGGRVGPYAKGVVVMQDDIDSEGEAPSTIRTRQNFKLVDWQEIITKLGIK
jgi:3-phytase